MEPPRPVLPYATPQSLRRIRKPLRTRIVRDENLPYLNFTEVSDDRYQAIGASLFVLFTLLIMAAMAWHEWQRLATLDLRRSRPGQALFLTAFCLIEVGAILAVIQIVWTRTTISVREGELWLEVVAPVGSNSRRWSTGQIVSIEAWTTDEGDMMLDPLAELHVRPRQGMTIKLLRNYPRDQLAPIAAALDLELSRSSGGVG
jgi:hypothetical protein